MCNVFKHIKYTVFVKKLVDCRDFLFLYTFKCTIIAQFGVLMQTFMYDIGMRLFEIGS